MEPKVFLGCSSKAKDIARFIQSDLQDIAQIKPWYQGVFEAGDYVLERLLTIVREFDFGVFLITPDDIGEFKGKRYLIARDNVLFEAGVFFTQLGRKRTLLVAPSIDTDGAVEIFTCPVT